MALLKSYMTPKGPASYWIAGLIQVDNFSKNAYGRLYGFVDKAHCDRPDGVPLISLEYRIFPDKYEEYFGKEVMILAGVTAQTQFYKIVKEIDCTDAQNEVINFNDATEVY